MEKEIKITLIVLEIILMVLATICLCILVWKIIPETKIEIKTLEISFDKACISYQCPDGNFAEYRGKNGEGYDFLCGTAEWYWVRIPENNLPICE